MWCVYRLLLVTVLCTCVCRSVRRPTAIVISLRSCSCYSQSITLCCVLSTRSLLVLFNNFSQQRWENENRFARSSTGPVCWRTRPQRKCQLQVALHVDRNNDQLCFASEILAILVLQLGTCEASRSIRFRIELPIRDSIRSDDPIRNFRIVRTVNRPL